MKTRTVRIVSAVLPLLLLLSVFAVFTARPANAAATKDGTLSVSPKTGSFGRTVEVTVTMPTGGGVTYSYAIDVDGTPIGSGSDAAPSSTANATFQTTDEEHIVTVTFTPSDGDPSEKTTKVTSSVPKIIVEKTTYTYKTGLGISVKIENPIEGEDLTSDGSATITGGGKSYMFYPDKAGTYKLSYEKADDKTIIIGKAPANLHVSQSSITVLQDDNAVINFHYDTDDLNDPASDIIVTTIASSLGDVQAKTATSATIKGKTVGSGKIQVYIPETTSYLEKTITIPFTVKDPNAPMIYASPSSVTLNKNNPTEKVTITLTNPVVSSSGYARTKVRIASPKNGYNGVSIDGHCYKNGNTYDVAVNGSSVSFDVTLKAKRSATYYMEITHADETIKVPITVTGYSTLPQTGPDYTLVYVFAGLLLLAGAGLVVINVLKKKNNGVD